MQIGVPAEIKDHEYRVALTPAAAHTLVTRGHTVQLQAGAGARSGYADADYRDAGATLVPTAEDAWSNTLVVKVKEPLPSEMPHFRPDLTLFTYLHLAANPALTDALAASGTTAIAYETVQLPDGSLPLLTPMSEVAGRLAPLMGATTLLAPNGGMGLVLGGVPGTRRARVVIIGGGVVGEHAAATADWPRRKVTVFDVSLPRLRDLDARYRHDITTLASHPYDVARHVREADLVIGAVLIPGAAAPHVVTDAMIRTMQPGSVLVDVAIDQGGCIEGSRPTTHTNPTFDIHGVIAYCVANIPGAAPATATPALTNATFPYLARLADHGIDAAIAADPALAAGVNVRDGQVVHPALAKR